MDWRSIVVIAICMALSACGPSQEVKDWEKAQNENSYDALKEFMEKYPGKQLENLEIQMSSMLRGEARQAVVFYEQVELKNEPAYYGKVISPLYKGIWVEILKKSESRSEKKFQNHQVKDYWLQVRLKNDKVGWLFGAALKADPIFCDKVKEYFELFPNRKNDPLLRDDFSRCDCNDWETASREDTKEAYDRYLSEHPDGIYANTAEILSYYYDKTICFRNQEEGSNSISGNFKSYEEFELEFSKGRVMGKLSGNFDSDYDYWAWGGKVVGYLSGLKLKLDQIMEVDGSELYEKVELTLEKGMIVKSEPKKEYLEIDCQN